MPENSKLESVLKWIVIVIAAVFALKIIFTVFAVAFVIGGFLLTKVLPLVILVWLVLKLVEWWKTKNGTVTTPEMDS